MAPKNQAENSNWSLFLFHVRLIVEHALNTKNWVVIVCPTQDTRADAGFVASSLLPDGCTANGRTTFLPDGGRLTIVAASDKIPQKGLFVVAFLGWGDADKEVYERMSRWREAAHDELGGLNSEDLSVG